MIISALGKSGDYYGLSPRVKRALEYIGKADLKTLEAGKYEIDGEQIFMIIAKDDKMKTREDAKLEAHNRYIDIQVPISGSETYGWSDRKNCKVQIGEFDNQRDIVFFEDLPSNYVTANVGEFVIFFPSDAHAPLIGRGIITKCIIKVEIL